VPAEQGLRAGDQGAQGVAREQPAEGGEEETIGRRPARAADLALDDDQLVAGGENLSTELKLRLAAGEQSGEEEADQRVEERERHVRDDGDPVQRESGPAGAMCRPSVSATRIAITGMAPAANQGLPR
jgi:hypothetical protein